MAHLLRTSCYTCPILSVTWSSPEIGTYSGIATITILYSVSSCCNTLTGDTHFLLWGTPTSVWPLHARAVSGGCLLPFSRISMSWKITSELCVPSCFGCCSPSYPWFSKAAMQISTIRAQEAFGALIATCSWLLAMAPCIPLSKVPWFIGMQEAQLSASQWLDEFAKSPITNLTPAVSWVRVVVTPGCHFLEQVPQFFKENVPVWILWDTLQH